MKCSYCVLEGLKSRVTPGMVSSTLMYNQPYYDEDGIYHYHDMNTHTQGFVCSNRHSWYVTSKSACPAGDFGGEEKVVRQPDYQPTLVYSLIDFTGDLTELPETHLE